MAWYFYSIPAASTKNKGHLRVAFFIGPRKKGSDQEQWTLFIYKGNLEIKKPPVFQRNNNGGF